MGKMSQWILKEPNTNMGIENYSNQNEHFERDEFNRKLHTNLESILIKG